MVSKLSSTVIRILQGELQAAIPDVLKSLLASDALELQRLWQDCSQQMTLLPSPDREVGLFRDLATYYLYQKSAEFEPASNRQTRDWYETQHYPASGDPERSIETTLEEIKFSNQDFFVRIVDAAKDILRVNLRDPYERLITRVIASPGVPQTEMLVRAINFVFTSEQADRNKLADCFVAQSVAPEQAVLELQLFLQLVVCLLHKTEDCTPENRSKMKRWADEYLYDSQLLPIAIDANSSERDLLYGIALRIFQSRIDSTLKLALFAALAKLMLRFNTTLPERSRTVYRNALFLYRLVQVVPFEEFDFEHVLETANADEKEQLVNDFSKVLLTIKDLVARYVSTIDMEALEADCSLLDRSIGGEYTHLSFWSYLDRDAVMSRILSSHMRGLSEPLQLLKQEYETQSKRLLELARIQIKARADRDRFRHYLDTWVQATFNQAVMDRFDADYRDQSQADETFVHVMLALLIRQEPVVALDEAMLIKHWESTYERIYEERFFQTIADSRPFDYALDASGSHEEQEFLPSWEKFSNMLVCNKRDDVRQLTDPARVDFGVAYVGLSGVGKTCMRASTLSGFDDPLAFREFGFRLLRDTVTTANIDEFARNDVRPTPRRQTQVPTLYELLFTQEVSPAAPGATSPAPAKYIPVPAIVSQLPNQGRRLYLHFIDTAGEDFSAAGFSGADQRSLQAVQKAPIIVVVLDASALVRQGLVMLNTISQLLQRRLGTAADRDLGQIVIFALNKVDLLEREDWPSLNQDILPGGMPILSEDVSEDDLRRIIFSNPANNAKITIQKALLAFINLFGLLIAGKGADRQDDFNVHRNRLVNVFWAFSKSSGTAAVVGAKVLPKNMFAWVYQYLRKASDYYFVLKEAEAEKRALLWDHYSREIARLNEVFLKVKWNLEHQPDDNAPADAKPKHARRADLRSSIDGFWREIHESLGPLNLILHPDVEDPYVALMQDIQARCREINERQLSLYADRVDVAVHHAFVSADTEERLKRIDEDAKAKIAALAAAATA